jgi:hypothetical protein
MIGELGFWNLPLWTVSAPGCFRRIVHAGSADRALVMAGADNLPGAVAELFPDREQRETVADARG